MAIFDLNISDSSPMIRYSGEWNIVLNDTYTQGRYHSTNDNSANATLDFYGSSVRVFGPMKPNNGKFKVSLDDKVTEASASATKSDTLDAVLFSSPSQLNDTHHRLVLRNAAEHNHSTSVEVDHIIITTGDGDARTISTDVPWDDDHPNITYSARWSNRPNGYQQLYYKNTLHYTQYPGAFASIIFTGNAIQVYGAVSSNHGLFSVVLDEGEPLTLNGSAPRISPMTLLYCAGGLSDGPHNVTFINALQDSRFLDLDKVIVSKWSLNPPDCPDGCPDVSATIFPTIQPHGAINRPGFSPSAIQVLIAGIFTTNIGVILVITGVLLLIWDRKNRALRHVPSRILLDKSNDSTRP